MPHSRFFLADGALVQSADFRVFSTPDVATSRVFAHEQAFLLVVSAVSYSCLRAGFVFGPNGLVFLPTSELYFVLDSLYQTLRIPATVLYFEVLLTIS
jgi:hypothetical protein